MQHKQEISFFKYMKFIHNLSHIKAYKSIEPKQKNATRFFGYLMKGVNILPK